MFNSNKNYCKSTEEFLLHDEETNNYFKKLLSTNKVKNKVFILGKLKCWLLKTKKRGNVSLKQLEESYKNDEEFSFALSELFLQVITIEDIPAIRQAMKENNISCEELYNRHKTNLRSPILRLLS